MKLNTQQVFAIKEQLGADPVEQKSDAETQLREAFGEHTFYADVNGLFVLEPASSEDSPESAESAHVIQIAAWANEEKDTLKSIEPKSNGVVVSLIPGRGASTTA
tara:strand:+ start:88 stop:402 length:315 start_codon:yes stop_codon:yes gene_type:complete